MNDMSKKQHWENIYQKKDTTSEVSWYQDSPDISIKLILSAATNKDGGIIDIGGGDSRLVDKLLELGFKNLSVLDISAKSLAKVKIRLGDKANLVTWIESDVLGFDTKAQFDIWHDRATFHFLTTKEDIDHYVEIAGKLIKPNGYLIIAAFSTSGPKRCSGLDITQYSEAVMKETFGRGFDHIKSFKETHITPFATKQSFQWTVFRKM